MARFALALVILGAINWLLVGIFQWDLVASIFGGDATREETVFSRIIYTLIGLAGLYAISFLFNARIPAKD